MNSSIKKIITDTFSLSASNFLSRFISFLVVMVITAALNLYDYGALMLAMTVTSPINLMASFGLGSVLVSDIARFRGEKKFSELKQLIKSCIILKLSITTIIVSVGWFFKPVLVERFGDIVNNYYYLLTIWIFAVIFCNIFTEILGSYEKFKTISISGLVEVSSKLIFVAIFWFLGIIDLKYALLAYVLSKITVDCYLFVSAIGTTWYLKNVKESKEPILWNIIRKHGKWDILSQSAMEQIDVSLRPWIVKLFVGVEGVAIFSVARKIYTAMLGLVPIKQVIFPFISRNLRDKAQNMLIAQKASKYSFIIYSVMAVFAFFLISPFILTFFPKYELSILLFRILLLRMLIMATSYGQVAFLYAYKQQKVSFMLSFIRVASLFTLLPLSLKLFALPGIYIEKIITLIILYSARGYYLRKKYGIVTWRFRGLIEYDKYDKYLVNKAISSIKSLYARKNKNLPL